MRLVLAFSGFLAATAAASDAARGTLLSTLTGRVDDAAAADRDDDEFADVAAPAFEGDAKNVSTVELCYQGAAAYLDDMSLFTLIANQSKWNASCDATNGEGEGPGVDDDGSVSWSVGRRGGGAGPT